MRGQACFIVIISLKSPPVLIGMDIMRPLRVRIDVTNDTTTPAQPDPQTIHLNAAQIQDPPPTSRALLLQTTNIPAETRKKSKKSDDTLLRKDRNTTKELLRVSQ